MKHYWLIPLGFVLAGVFMWIFTMRYKAPRVFGALGKFTNQISKKMAPVFYPIFIGLSALAFVILLFSGISNYNTTREILASGNFEIVEGKVENYQRYAPRNVQVKELFTIGGIEFDFDESDATYYGYRPDHKTQIIFNGMHLRISHYLRDKKRIVLKIEQGK